MEWKGCNAALSSAVVQLSFPSWPWQSPQAVMLLGQVAGGVGHSFYRHLEFWGAQLCVFAWALYMLIPLETQLG